MPSNISVRFLNNFILTVIQTLEVDGKLMAKEKQFHIKMGDIYPVAQYERHEDGRLDLQFPDSCILAGLTHNVEKDYCELMEPKTNVSARISGCGGCGNKNK